MLKPFLSFCLPFLRCVAGFAFGAALIVFPLWGKGGSVWAQQATIETLARQVYLIDFETGAVLYDKGGEEKMPPSSMSKLMTAVMVFERLKEGSLSLDELFRVSEYAWRAGGAASGGSTMFLQPNSKVRLEDLIRGMIVQSGNDASIVIAENLMGSEKAFAEAATRRAKEIGLKNSNFTNSTGLPDPDHYMTAQDLAFLAKYVIKEFPEYYGYYSEKEFTYNRTKQGNRNPLLYSYPGADGLKTGHTSAAGYGLTASAVSGGRRLILVVNGLPSMKARAEEAAKLMDWGFRNFENKLLFTVGETISTAGVWLGEKASVALTTPKDLKLTLPRRAVNQLSLSVSYLEPISAPIAKGSEIATLVVSGPGLKESIRVPLVAAESVQKAGLFQRIGAQLKALVFGFPGEKANPVSPATR